MGAKKKKITGNPPLHDQLIFTPCVVIHMQLKPQGEDAERVRDKPNDCKLRWAGKLCWCAHGNDASKPFHVGLLIPLAFAVGTDAENKQNQMMACGMVWRNSLHSKPTGRLIYICAVLVAQMRYQRFISQLLLDIEDSFHVRHQLFWRRRCHFQGWVLHFGSKPIICIT